MPFRFRLEKVMRYRRKLVDEKSRDVAVANRVVAGLEGRLADLRGEIARTRAVALAGPGESVRVGDLATRTAWSHHLARLAAVVEGQLAEARAEVARRREELTRAYRDVEVLEKLRTRQEAAWVAARNRREMQELDEIGQLRAERQRRSKLAP